MTRLSAERISPIDALSFEDCGDAWFVIDRGENYYVHDTKPTEFGIIAKSKKRPTDAWKINAFGYQPSTKTVYFDQSDLDYTLKLSQQFARTLMKNSAMLPDQLEVIVYHDEDYSFEITPTTVGGDIIYAYRAMKFYGVTGLVKEDYKEHLNMAKANVRFKELLEAGELTKFANCESDVAIEYFYANDPDLFRADYALTAEEIVGTENYSVYLVPSKPYHMDRHGSTVFKLPEWEYDCSPGSTFGPTLRNMIAWAVTLNEDVCFKFNSTMVKLSPESAGHADALDENYFDASFFDIDTIGPLPLEYTEEQQVIVDQRRKEREERERQWEAQKKAMKEAEEIAKVTGHTQQVTEAEIIAEGAENRAHLASWLEAEPEFLVKEGKEEEFETLLDDIHTGFSDHYDVRVRVLVKDMGRILQARMKEEGFVWGKNVETRDLIESTVSECDYDGLSGNMVGMAKHILFHYWVHGNILLEINNLKEEEEFAAIVGE